jgi:hypothetical protein
MDEIYLLSCGCVIKLISAEPHKYGFVDIDFFRCSFHKPVHGVAYEATHPLEWSNKARPIDKTELAILKLQKV